MKNLFLIFALLHGVLSGVAAGDISTVETTHVDTVPGPKVEINGGLKINNMPMGEGMQVVTDQNGYLYTSSMSTTSTGSGHDSLTYTVITGFGPVFQPGTYPLASFSSSAALGSSEIWTFSLSKCVDNNSVGFTYLMVTQPVNSIVIEIKVYESGAPTPYFSHKLTNIHIQSASVSTGGEIGTQIESYTLIAQIVGLKNHITGNSFAWDTMTNMEVTY